MPNKHAFYLSLLFIFILLTPFARVKAQITRTGVTGIHTFASSSRLADGYWVKISITGTGVYQITDSELRKMGFSDPSKVGVYGFGGNILSEDFSNPHIDDLPEVAVYRDDAGGRTLFYGVGPVSWYYKNSAAGYVHKNNPYSTKGYYFLHQKSEAPKSMRAVGEGAYVRTIDVFDDYLLHESDLENVGETGREMYGESFVYTRVQSFKFYTPNITTDKGKITVSFMTHTEQSSKLVTSLNGVALAESTLGALGSSKYVTGVEANKISEWNTQGITDNVIRLTFTPGSGSVKRANLNFIRLNMKRNLLLDGSAMAFRSRETVTQLIRFRLNNYNTAHQIWDVTDQTDICLQSISQGNDGKYGFTPQVVGQREYVWVNPGGSFSGVTDEGAVENQNLHALPQTDMVIIAAPKLQSEAERLAEYRRKADGLHVTVVNPEAIYNEFSSGAPDATAYRLFMKMFYDRGIKNYTKPQYLLLFGDGSYDNRGLNTTIWKPAVIQNMLLTYQSEASLDETKSYVCDDYFGFLDDDEGGKLNSLGEITLTQESLDLGIGRFPVRTATEAAAVVDKVIAYSDNKLKGSWKNKLCFIGDDGDSHEHVRQADRMVKLLQGNDHNEFIYNKIYLDSYKRISSSSGTEYPDAKKKLHDLLQSGVLMVNYSGHGSTSMITHEKIYTSSDASSIQMKHLPVWVTATCDFSRYDAPQTSAGELTLLNPNGGGIALFTTSRVVYSTENGQINAGLLENMFKKRPDGTRYRLGDLMRLAKRTLGTQINKLNFVLLGDPSMKFGYPEFEMEVTEIDGKPVGEEPVQMRALSSVTVKGRVKEVGTDDTDTGFTGLIYPTIFDCQEEVPTLDNDNIGTSFVFNDRTKKLFTGRDSVRNGEFEFSFIVPKDISYSMDNGLMNLYAHDNRGNEAQGYFDNYVLGGTADDVDPDTLGPVIESMFLNVDSFRDGDEVNATPYFVAHIKAESGINTTGNSIGHDLMLTIRGNGSVIKYVLNDYFITETGQYKQGSVKFSIPELAGGDYTMELKVWDNHNNSSSRTVSCEVNSAAKPQIFDLSVCNNPVKESARFLLSHNRPETKLNVRIQVYTQMGKCVWDKEVSGMSEYMDSFPILWDLRSDDNTQVVPGIYIYRASVSTDGQHYTTRSKKLIVLQP